MPVVAIHQTLHGYTDGHRLLESSKPLPDNVHRLMVVLSDISGPSAGQEFRWYLTGYPVDADTYALARTWRASEMPRPGCVWTHTLLIGIEDLAAIRDPRRLFPLFRRPQGNNREGYRTAIEVGQDLLFSGEAPKPEVSFDVAAWILAGLYGHSGVPVQLVTDDYPRYEELVLAIWMQQWSRLRHSFTFCTFALGNRTLGGVPFALEISPRKAVARSVNRSESVVIDLDTALESPPGELWIRATVEDLLAADSAKSLRRFLHEFGSDVSRGAVSFPALVRIHQELGRLCRSPFHRDETLVPAQDRQSEIGELIGLVNANFPEPKQATHLKRAAFGAAASSWNVWTPADEAQLLLELVTTMDCSGLEGENLEIARRTALLWQKQPEIARRITLEVLDRKLNPLGYQFLDGVCQGITAEELSRLTTARPEFLATVVQHNPRLATSELLWTGSDDRQRELWEAVRGVEALDKETRSGILRAMLVVGCDGLADDVVSHFAPDAVEHIMDLVDESGSGVKQLSSSWRRALAQRQTDLVKWLVARSTPSVNSLSLLAVVLEPDFENVLQVDVGLWYVIAAKASNEAPPPIELMVFLLCIGFESHGDRAGELVALTFEPVHDAAWNSLLSYRAWSILQRRVPRIRRDWDRCERLRRALVDRFLKDQWPLRYLLQAGRNERTFDLIMEYCYSKAPGGRDLIYELMLQIEKGAASVSEAQSVAVTRYAKRARH